jgi:poly(hydroxyalkanoate) granule-associated protein
LPLCGKKSLTFLPQRVIFSPVVVPQSGMTSRTAPARQTPGEAGKEAEMIAKKKRKEIQNDIMDSAHKVWLAGLGAVAMAEQEGSKFFTNLVEQGQGVEKKGKKEAEKVKGTVAGMKTVAESYWETFGRTIDDQVTAVIHRIGVPTKDEIETLTSKVEALTAAVDKLRATEAPKAAAAAKKPAAKKTTAKKAAPKKTAAKK